MTFYDDGPQVSLEAATSGVSLDETTAGEAFANGPISATSTAAVVSSTTLLYGADDAAASEAQVYSLELSGASASGLQTAEGDYAITLSATGNTLTGSYIDGAGASQTAFTVQINSDGTLTVTQYVALEHTVDGDGTNGEYNDTLNLAGLITARITLTDAEAQRLEGKRLKFDPKK